MFVSCECCVLSGRGLCDELITRPEESYRLWCVVLCDPETSKMRRPWPALGRSAPEKKVYTVYCNVFNRLVLSLTGCHSNSHFVGNCLLHDLTGILRSDRHNWIVYKDIYFIWLDIPNEPSPPHCWGFEITPRHTTLNRTSLDERSAHCRKLYLTTLIREKTSFLQAGF